MTSVRIEIEAKLASFAASRSVPVAYENVPFTRPTVGCWLEIDFLTETYRSRGLAAVWKTAYGTFQITVCGQQGIGMGVLEALADDVANLFPVIPKMPLTSIEAPPNVGRNLIVDDYVCLPVTVRYRAEF